MIAYFIFMDYLIKFGFYVQFVYLYFLSFNQNVQNNDNLMFMIFI
jgi:hypothetical protein